MSALIPIALAVATSFNLVCVGVATAEGDGKPAGKESFETTLRLDLRSQRFCQDECDRTLPIVRVGETEIVLQEHNIGRMKIVHRAHRETGEYHHTIRFGPVFVSRSGSCRRTQFSGFPARKF